MPVANIDTFEHDIADEIKKKEASFTDIASAGGTVENTPPPAKRALPLALVLMFVMLGGLLSGAGGYSFLFLMKHPQARTPPVHADPIDTMLRMRDISTTLDRAVGTSVTSVEKGEAGYVVTLQEYAPVFAYMIRNEASYAEEIGVSVGSPRDASTSSPPFTFKDVTIRNQNMRVGTSASSTVAYAFVNTTHLLVSSSTEGILALRGGILR